jgi:hypothetical protein
MKVSVSKFNHLLESWAAQTPPIMHFTVENVLEVLGLDNSYYNQVLKLLMKRDGDEIKAEKMGLCPSNHKLQTFALDEEIEEYFECFCQPNEFEITKFKLVFSFDEDFIADSFKKKNHLNSKDLMVI